MYFEVYYLSFDFGELDDMSIPKSVWAHYLRSDYLYS